MPSGAPGQLALLGGGGAAVGQPRRSPAIGRAKSGCDGPSLQAVLGLDAPPHRSYVPLGHTLGTTHFSKNEATERRDQRCESPHEPEMLP